VAVLPQFQNGQEKCLYIYCTIISNNGFIRFGPVFTVQFPYTEGTVLKDLHIAPYVEMNMVKGDMHKQEKYLVKMTSFAL
jgi:hypothetical protein